MEAFERTLPHSLDAERSILGAVLLHDESLLSVEQLLPSDFFREAHKRLYACFLGLSDAGVPIDLTTVRDALVKTGEWDDVGGPAYVTSLVDGLPRSTNIAAYATIVKEKSRLRAAIYAANKLSTAAYEERDDVSGLLGTAAEELFALGGQSHRTAPRPIAELYQASMDAIEQAHSRGGVITGLATGFTELDEMLAGLQPSDLILIAARTSMGKTSLAMNIARSIGTDATVLVFSLEMSGHQLFVRLLSSEARVDSHRLRAGFLSPTDWARVATAAEHINNSHLIVDDTPGLSVLDIRARARTVRKQFGLKLIVVDYLQLMKGHGRFDNRTQEVGIISRGLKGLAKELDVPVIALSQLSRAPEQRKGKRPQLSDLRESGDLEHDADVVVFIYRPEQDGDDDAQGVAELIVSKQRNGPTGSVKVAFVKEYTRFENLYIPKAD